MENVSDETLVQQAVAGDYGAFEVLVERHSAQLYRLAVSMTRNTSDAEEVLQETFLQAFRALASFRGDSKFSTWVTRITMNAVLMRLRKRRRKPTVSIEEVACPPESPLWPSGSWARLPERSALDGELRAHVQACVAALPEKHRIVLLLKDVQGLSNAEIGETIGESVATVKSRLHRARSQLRAALEEYLHPGVDENAS